MKIELEEGSESLKIELEDLLIDWMLILRNRKESRLVSRFFSLGN